MTITENKPFHLAVRGILQNDKGEYLILKRSDQCKHQPGSWEFPGGKVDHGEDFATALIREFKEETSLDIKLNRVMGSGDKERENYKIAYLFLEVEQTGGDLQISDEHDEYAWVSRKNLVIEGFSPQLQNLVKSIKSV